MAAERSVLVTGASSGIGFACARDLAAAGWRTFGGYRAEDAADRLRAVGVEPVRLDVTSDDDVAAALATVGAATNGTLDALVNNAGVATGGPVEHVPIDAWRGVFEVNVFGQVRVTQAALPLLRRTRGRVVFVSSIGGRLSVPMFAPYSSSKAALESVAEALRAELADAHVGVAVLEPGAVATAMWSAAATRWTGPNGDGALYGRTAAQAEALVRSLKAGAAPPEAVSSVVLDILTAPTIRDRYGVSAATRATPPPSERPLPRRGPVATGRRTGTRLPSFSEERLLFLDLLSPGDAAYNVPAAVRLRGLDDPDRLLAALDHVLRRYDAFRTTYRHTPRGPRAVVGDEPAVDLSTSDLREADDPEARLHELVRLEVARPFDLQTGPLARFHLTRVGAREHVLVVVVHHIVCDGWSLALVLRDLGRRLAGGDDLPPPSLSFSDVVGWQRHALASGELDESIAYWVERLRDVEVLDLPTDRPRPATPSGIGAVVPFVVPVAARETLRAVAAGTGTTLFTALLSAFAVLLHRYSGSATVTIGTPVANRSGRGVADVVGFVVNTLAWRVDVDPTVTFRDLLATTKQEVHRGLDHQDAPFERVVEVVRPMRRAGENPLFRVMLVLQNVTLPADAFPGADLAPLDEQRGLLRDGGLTLAALEAPNETSKFDLSLQAEEVDAGLAVSLEYDTDLFDRETVERMGRHLERLLTAVTANPDAQIGAVDFLDDEERDRPARQWASFGPAPTETIVDRFERVALEHPDREAVVDGERRVTYRQLDALADRVAAGLVDAEVPAGSVVGVCLRRGAEAVAAVLGVLRAGCAFLPLDPDHPAARRGAQLSIASAAAVVAAGEEPGVDGLPTVVVAPGDSSGPASDRGRRHPSVDDVAYVVFTSGSTGEPKGVAVAHRSVANALAGWEEAYRLGEVTRHLQAASFTFDVWIGDLVRAVGAGGTMVVCGRETLLDPPALHDLLERERVELVELVPATARLLAEHLERVSATLTSLRFLIVGSDVWLTRDHLRLQALVAADCEVVNSFGLTEATIDNALHVGPAPAGAGDAVVPIGRPMRNTTMYVLDRDGRQVPTGVVGELYVGGDGLAIGYVGRPDLTEERFLPDPFSPRPGARMYRTGDLARCGADGSVECLGRVDRQVKVNGVRVELGEVEAAVASQPGVASAVVTARPGAGGVGSLVAHVVPAAGHDLQVDDLAGRVAERLPRAFRPAAYRVVAALPLTTSGKVDVAALHAATADVVARRSEPPRTPLERTLAVIWKATLDLDDVGIDDDFFEVGGHSLLMTHIASQVGDAVGRAPTVRQLFERTTIRELAEAMDRDEGARPPVAAPRLARRLTGVFVDQRGRAHLGEEAVR